MFHSAKAREEPVELSNARCGSEMAHALLCPSSEGAVAIELKGFPPTTSVSQGIPSEDPRPGVPKRRAAFLWGDLPPRAQRPAELRDNPQG